MKRFLKIVLTFLLPIILIGGGMEYSLRKIPNRFKKQADYLQEHSDDIETLILGSSHSLYGINPMYLNSNAFNLSNISQTLDIDARLLYELGIDMDNLKQLVVRLSYTTLYETLESGNEKWRLKDYEQVLNVNVSKDPRYNFELLSVNFKQNLYRLWDYYINGSSQMNFDEKGWSNNLSFQRSPNLDSSGKVAAKKHTAQNNNMLEVNKTALYEMLEWCKQKDIEVILVTLPAYKTYYDNLEENQLSTTIKVGQDIQDNFSNCKYYNFLDDARFTKTDFYDADHLNAQGSEKFSKLLNTLLSH